MELTTKLKNQTVEINRRQFVITTAVVGGGLMVGLGPVGDAIAATTKTEPWSQETGGTDFTAFITIAANNTVTIRSTSPDIGNGTFTATPMIVTEELKCDWDLVQSEFVPANRDLMENGLYSKSGVLAYFSGRSTGKAAMDQLLQVGASTRERLRMAAAKKWGVDVSEVKAEKSTLTHTGSGKKLTYGDVAAAAASIQLDKEPEVTPRDQWTFLGKSSPKKLQLPLILNGSAEYGIDVQVPGMVYAALRQVPVQGGKLKSHDASAIMKMPGVRAVVVVNPEEVRPGLPDGHRAPFGFSALNNGPMAAVAVVADHYWQAQTALDLMPVEWDAGEGQKWDKTQTIYDGLLAAVESPKEPNVIADQGDALAALQSGKKMESSFMTPYMDHFNMEPLNGTALLTDDRVDLWMPTQHPQQCLYSAADETGVHPEKVHVHQTWVGTGLGRRVYGNDARMVMAVANKVRGTPVKVIWTREESMRQGRYRDLIGGKLSASVGDDGMPTAVAVSVAGSRPVGRNLSDTPYMTGVKNWRVQATTFNTNLMTGPWRGPVYNSNCFMLETFINELAEAAGKDAIEYRQKLLANFEDKSWIKLLDVVAQKSGWGNQQPRGTAQGVAIGNWGMAARKEGGPTPYSGTTVVAVVTAEVSRRGQIYIPRVDIAIDTGSFINEEMITLAVEGGVNMSLGAALHEEINVDQGRVVEGNLDTYRLLRQNDPALPQEIHVHYEGMSGHERFSEAGEPPMGPPPPALAHAIFKVTGKWLRRHPFDRESLV